MFTHRRTQTHMCMRMHVDTRTHTHTDTVLSPELISSEDKVQIERERKEEREVEEATENASYLVYVVVSRGPDWGLALWGQSEHGLGLCGTVGSARLNRSAEKQTVFLIKGTTL